MSSIKLTIDNGQLTTVGSRVTDGKKNSFLSLFTLHSSPIHSLLTAHYSLIILLSVIFFTSCAAVQKGINEDGSPKVFTVKVINTSLDKVMLRYQNDDSSYTFRFVDTDNNVKFTMNGELIIQYSLVEYDDAKIFSIKQDTLIHVKQNDIIIDDLPLEEKIKPVVEKDLKKTK